MDLKTCSTENCIPFYVLLATISACFLLNACSGIQTEPTLPDMGLPTPEIVEKPDSMNVVPDSRMLASHSLTQEGYQLLKKKDLDAAIRILERAVGINPSDGPGYYYLAEAWINKNNFNLASQFNRLALLYLRSDPTWAERAERQKKRIKRGVEGL